MDVRQQYGDEAMVNSIIGEGSHMKGELYLSGMLRVDGDFTGVVHTNGQVLIGRTGRADCTMHAGKVIVAGVVRGDIVATELVELRANAIMIGTIRTPRLIVEDGVLCSGRCDVGGAGIEALEREEAAEDERPASTYLPKSA